MRELKSLLLHKFYTSCVRSIVSALVYVCNNGSGCHLLARLQYIQVESVVVFDTRKQFKDLLKHYSFLQHLKGFMLIHNGGKP